jgi:hypothetical protein
VPHAKHPEVDAPSHKFMVSVADNIFLSLEQDAKNRGITVQERIRQILGDEYTAKK